MKINNKGFAISTILYGILSLSIIILLLTFGIMKASKDQSNALVDGVLTGLNKCLSEEVQYEACLYSGDSCDPSTYNKCIGKVDSDLLLASVAKVGDYVDYDAGNWSSNASIPNSEYSFGGYTKDESKNASVSCGSYNNDNYGWQILKIDGNIVTLIHSGITECFYYGNNENKALYVLTGRNPNGISTSGLTVRNWNNTYLNPDYATSSGIVTKELLIGSSTLPASVDAKLDNLDNLFNSNQSYILGDTFNNHLTYISNNTISTVPSTNTVYGIKPIVVLKSGVKTSGAMSNTGGSANSKTWILVK